MQSGQDFSLRVLLRANFEFLFFKFSALPLSLLTLPLLPFLFFSSFFHPLSLRGFVCSPVGCRRSWFHGRLGHREDALCGERATQTCLFGLSGILSVDLDVLRVGMDNDAASWRSDRGHARLAATVVRRGVGAGMRVSRFPGFFPPTCEWFASRTCTQDRRSPPDH